MVKLLPTSLCSEEALGNDSYWGKYDKGTDAPPGLRNMGDAGLWSSKKLGRDGVYRNDAVLFGFCAAIVEPAFCLKGEASIALSPETASSVCGERG